MVFNLLLKINVGGKIWIEYLSSHNFIFIAYLKHLYIFTHFVLAKCRNNFIIKDSSEIKAKATINYQLTSNTQQLLIAQQSQKQLKILFIIIVLVIEPFVMTSINYLRSKEINRFRSYTFTDSNADKLLHQAGRKYLQLKTINKLRRSLLRAELNQTPTNKLQTVSSSINRQNLNKSDKMNTKSQISEPDLLNTEQFVITLCKNFQANKFKIRPSMNRTDQKINCKDFKNQKEYKWGKIRTKLLAKKYTLEYGLQINDLGQEIKESNRQVLKLRMKELQGQDEKEN